MNDAAHPLPTCQLLADLSAQMLAAAHAAQWDQVRALERRYSSQAHTLDLLGAPPSAQERRELAELLRAVQVNEHAVRDMLAERMRELSALAASAGTERKLARAYGGA